MEAQDQDAFMFQFLPDMPDHDSTMAHAQMLVSGGFIDVSGHTIRISWAGYEFLDSVRDPDIWRKTKAGAEKMGSWTIKLLADLATGFIKAKAIELGLPLS
jgi:hypothetical protein